MEPEDAISCFGLPGISSEFEFEGVSVKIGFDKANFHNSKADLKEFLRMKIENKVDGDEEDLAKKLWDMALGDMQEGMGEKRPQRRGH